MGWPGVDKDGLCVHPIMDLLQHLLPDSSVLALKRWELATHQFVVTVESTQVMPIARCVKLPLDEYIVAISEPSEIYPWSSSA